MNLSKKDLFALPVKTLYLLEERRDSLILDDLAILFPATSPMSYSGFFRFERACYNKHTRKKYVSEHLKNEKQNKTKRSVSNRKRIGSINKVQRGNYDG